MFREMMIVLVFCGPIFAQNASEQKVQLRFSSNKSEYVCSEPVLLKTGISNPSIEPFNGNSPDYGWTGDQTRFGFTMYAGRDGNDLNDIMRPQTKRDLGISAPPTNYNFFHDRHWLPRRLFAGEKAERVDVLIVPTPGTYWLKAVLKERDGTTHASEPIRFQVSALEAEEDSISKLGGQEFVTRLGLSMQYYHYIGEEWGDALPTKKFEELAPVIMEQHKDSVFREYVMYAEAIMRCRPPDSQADVPLTERGKQLAEQFIVDYPHSWLLPDIYDKLFWVDVQQKNKAKAEDVRKKALEIAPNATVLRDVKKANIDELLR